jgi:hypothetical protein
MINIAKLPNINLLKEFGCIVQKFHLGQHQKLHRKWVGPYYITIIGPNYIYRLRHAKANKEVKSLMNAMRLKPYFDPNDRLTNPPKELENRED